LTSERRVATFFRIWTVREAVAKLRSEGIFTLSARFDVVAGPGHGLSIARHPEEPARILVGAVPAPAGHVGALAVEGKPGAVRFFRLA
jgi:phosphopantetheinyl transferase